MDSVGEGEGGKIWENGLETCKISCMKWVASPGSMHDTGCLGLVRWDDPGGLTFFVNGHHSSSGKQAHFFPTVQDSLALVQQATEPEQHL